MTKLLDENPAITAIVSMNDLATVGVVGEIEARGWSIPADFSVMSIVSSTAVARMSRPHLTTSAPPAKQLGQLAVKQLTSQIEGHARTVLGPDCCPARCTSGRAQARHRRGNRFPAQERDRGTRLARVPR